MDGTLRGGCFLDDVVADSLNMTSSPPGPQPHHHHLLRRVSVRGLLRRGHLRDGLRHRLLRHLHDGPGQADPSGELGLECESQLCTSSTLTLARARA